MADRKIFEDVSTTGDAPKGPTPGALSQGGQARERATARLWLAVLFTMVVVMIAVGGLTRLTDSGLSITEWAPFTGAVPPFNAADWQAEFEKYKEIPEFQLQNSAMTLGEFKVIYWWEWGHRQLGRVIGLVWALGFGGLVLTRRLPRGWTGRFFLLGALGGLQGAIGWWMVSSGLEGMMLDVASYRLAIHLGLAFVILGLIAWFILKLSRSDADHLQARRAGTASLVKASGILIAFAFLQILLGALVAGIDAGRNFSDWPLMAGGLFPPEPFALEPFWRNFFEDDGLVQFNHRLVGYSVAGLTIWVWLKTRRVANAATQSAGTVLLFGMLLQMVLGVMTVLYAAPLQLAIFHQIGAILFWVLALRLRYFAFYPLPQSVRR